MRVEQAEKAPTRFTGITPKRSTKPWWNGRATCRALLLFSTVLWLFVGSAKADLLIPGTNSAAATYFLDSNGATGTAVSAVGAGGFASAFPGRNKSYLAVVSDAPPGTNNQAAANVHFDVVNKTTGRVDPFAVVLLQIYGTASISNPADINDHAEWIVTAAHDQPPPLLDFSTNGNGIVFATMLGGGFSVSNPSTYGYGFAAGAARGGQTDNFVGSEYQDALVPLGTKSPVTKSPNPNLGIGLVLFTDGHVDVDAEVNLTGPGAVALDPVLTALNPNDIIVSDALFNPNPDAPLLTAAQIAEFTAGGVDLSGFREGGLIGGAPVPEPGYLLLLGVGIAIACWRKHLNP
jgi:hypothetical protein